MAFTPKSPYPKQVGNPIRSTDWNEHVEETRRLDVAKLDRTGGAVSGPLSLQQSLTVAGPATLGAGLTVAGSAEVGGAAVLRASASVGGTLTVAGTAAFSGPTTFSGVRIGGGGAPQDTLDVVGAARIGSGANPVRFTSGWSGFPDSTTNQAEISNDTGGYKTLMIVGNKSGNNVTRKVSVWDRLEVNGASCAHSFCNLSDARLKTDLTDIERPLERVSQLRGLRFRWREGAVGGSPVDRPTGIGVLAQDVAAVFPELVTPMGTDDRLAVDYSGLTAVLLEAVKALSADNRRLAARLAALETAATGDGSDGQ